MGINTLSPTVAQFILGQPDIRECVPFLINRDNVI